MRNEDMPAMPMFSSEAKPCELRDTKTKKSDFASGFTKRELVVKDFMCALAAETSIPKSLAYLANELADAYFESLEK